MVRCPRCGQTLPVPFPYQDQGVILATAVDQEPRRSSLLLWFLGIGAIVFVMFMAAVVALIGYRVAMVSRPATSSFQQSFSPVMQDVEISNEDYAEARKNFRTNLIVEGPSPQKHEPFGIPENCEKIRYQSGDNSFPAIITQDPMDGKKHPAVLFLHIGHAYGDVDWMASRSLQTAGYVVMIPTLRSQNGNAGSFSYYYNEVDDVLAAATKLAEIPYVDATQIFLCGHGDGATIGLLAAMTSNAFKGIGAIAPHVNFHSTQVAWQAIPVPFDLTNDREIQMRSPLAFARSLKCPARLYQGTDVPWSHQYFLKLVEITKDQNVRAEFLPGQELSIMSQGLAKCLEFFAELRAASNGEPTPPTDANPPAENPLPEQTPPTTENQPEK